MHIYIYIYMCVCRNIERRASSTEIRSVYICRQPLSRCPLSPPTFSGLCMNHDAPVSSPWDRFFVSPTFAGSSSRRERNHSLTLRLAIGGPRARRSERKRACERAERAKREPVQGPDNAQRWIIDPQIDSVFYLFLSWTGEDLWQEDRKTVKNVRTRRAPHCRER